jgi:tRNA-specific 2-thiouridylase
VAAPEPLYVGRKEASSGRVVVGPRDALAATSVSVAGAVLRRDASEVDRVKLRYRSAPVGCRVGGDPRAGRHRSLTLDLDEPVWGIAPGQTACLMRGEVVIGFATIAPPGARVPTSSREKELLHAP